MNFKEWFNEVENYHTRSDRFLEIVCDNDVKLFNMMTRWLEAAWEAGLLSSGIFDDVASGTTRSHVIEE